MKKLILFATIILGAISVHAVNTTTQQVLINQSVNAQEEFTEVSSDAIPAAVKSTIEKSFPGTKLEKAYKNEKNEYKLEIAKDDKKFTVFTDASGNIIKK
ncbi:PepSY-like domain-containing protein [Flavobacterium aquicola]|uniref:Putative PepSY-like beta-lactamase-inhibitor n=1 Tax=Flavobacterium aquicola TaxID=1682742 RepID=A0A3E0E410_9FLAO|nr:PepSY-like domain-containing protein [Flavobacterium aquicola]REG93022.1 putative PepSY-like beta-lactamase-inhibitor [Flavobacterium aquicola]